MERKEETREIAVAIGGPVIKNQLTSQLPCESRPIMSARAIGRGFFGMIAELEKRGAEKRARLDGARRLCDSAGKETLCFP